MFIIQGQRHRMPALFGLMVIGYGMAEDTYADQVTGQGHVPAVFGLKAHGITAHAVMHGTEGIGDNPLAP